MKHKYTEQQLRTAIENALSIRQALINLNVKPQGGNYDVIRKAIKKYKIDASHFLGKSTNKGKTSAPRRNIGEYLNNNFAIGSNRLKKRLIKEKLLTPRCYMCDLNTWLGLPITLELDHINGNKHDNTLSNLRLLCPNCHSLTPTFRGRNKKKREMVPETRL